LLLGEVGRLNNISVEPDELKRAIMARAAQFPGKEKEVVAMYRDNAEALMALRGPIFEDKVVDFILAMADIEDKQVTSEELLREPDETVDSSSTG
jgi:trigger factor